VVWLRYVCVQTVPTALEAFGKHSNAVGKLKHKGVNYVKVTMIRTT
jgi:hypothetical protein